MKNRHRRQSQENAELEVRLETCNARRDRSVRKKAIKIYDFHFDVFSETHQEFMFLSQLL